MVDKEELFAAREIQWQRIRGKLQAEYGDGIFRSWLKPMALQDAGDDSVVVSVPTRFMRDRVNAIYGDRLRSLWTAEGVSSVELVVVTDFVETLEEKPKTKPADPPASAAKALSLIHI